MQFLGLEKVTGTLSVGFGKQIPEAHIYFVSGAMTTAEFGSIVKNSVLDVLLCQEFAIKEISFSPGRLAQVDEDAVMQGGSNLSGMVLNTSKNVDECAARTLIYGLMPMTDRKDKNADSLLHVLHGFQSWETELKSVPKSKSDKKAPLKQCVLLSRALRAGVIAYQTPIVSLKEIRPLINMLNPMSEKEEKNLRGYLRSLLPHPRATHLSIERFYAFASAIESIAQRRSTEVGDKARRAIQELVQESNRLNDVASV